MTDTLGNLVGSIDWSKMMSSTDVRNAAVGAALGGLVLGGQSLMSERDPEESRFAPVKDALLGALLGGAAGYAIPKGLELFRHSGTLAPDDDRLQTGGAGSAALKGLGVGTAVGGAVIAPTALRTAGQMRTNYAKAMDAYNKAVKAGRKGLSKPKPYRFSDFIRRMGGGAAPVAVRPGRFEGIRDWWANLTNGQRHYAAKPWAGTWRAILSPKGVTRPGGRILGRLGRYGAAGAALGLLGHALFGGGPQDNFGN